MFPVCTGINRSPGCRRQGGLCVPCMHRDKPKINSITFALVYVFPVCTGINRTIPKQQDLKISVPCMHRDKPTFLLVAILNQERSLYTQG